MAHQSKLVFVLKSPAFWTALITIVMLVVAAFVPEFPVTGEDLIAVVIPLVAFVASVTIRPINEWIGSRRFWSLLIAVVMVFIDALVPGFPFTADQLIMLTSTLAAIIVGSGLEQVP